MSISLSEIKEEIKKSSSSKSGIIFFKEDSKYRVRFLNDLEDGVKIPFHKNFKRKIEVPCQKMYGRECEYCEDEELALKPMVAWSVYEYESGNRMLILVPINRCSPVQVLAEAYQKYGTLLDRDYEIKQIGSGTNKTFAIFPGEKRDFKNKKVKPMSESAILKMIDKAYPPEFNDMSGDEEDGEREYRQTESERERKRREKEYMNKPEIDESDDWGEEEDEKPDYNSMKPKELYELCSDRGIDCPVRKSKQFYIDLLKQDDSENDDDWGEEEDDELPFH